MLIVFFDTKGVTATEWVRRKRPELWENDSWTMRRLIMPYLLSSFWPKIERQCYNTPPYSAVLAPCDFWLFPKLKSALKGTRFERVEAVKTKSTEVLQEKDFQHCFNQWKMRMERWDGEKR